MSITDSAPIREQAREAIKERMLAMVINESWIPEGRVEEYADAASDVWEPLCRELMGALESWNPDSRILARAKAALADE